MLLKMRAALFFTDQPGHVKIKSVLRFYERRVHKLHLFSCLCVQAHRTSRVVEFENLNTEEFTKVAREAVRKKREKDHIVFESRCTGFTV